MEGANDDILDHSARAGLDGIACGQRCVLTGTLKG